MNDEQTAQTPPEQPESTRVRLPIRWNEEQGGHFYAVQAPGNFEDLVTSEVFAGGKSEAIAAAERFAQIVKGSDFEIVDETRPADEPVGEGPAEVRD
jgi:hypothetical protein